jgi:D-inositol-3-phosphate glycosyltransferase
MTGRRLRLLGLTNFYPPEAAGGYGEICADVMEELGARGHDVEMLTATRGAPGELPAERGRVRIDRSLSYVLAAWRHPVAGLRAVRHDRERLDSALARGRPDAAVVWHMRGIAKTTLTALHELGIPVLYMLHDRWVLYERAGSLYVPWARLDRLGAARARALAGLAAPPIATQGEVCFVSRWLEEQHRERGWRPRRSHVVPCGVRPADVRSRPEPTEVRRLLFAGRVEPRKGLHVAIEALARVEWPLELTIAGPPDDPAYAERVREAARSAGVADRLTWLGELPRRRILELFADHDALVYPSTDFEAYSLGLVEAFPSGIPIVTSAPGGPREYLRDGDNALLFEPGDAPALARQLERLAESEPLRRTLLEGALRSAAELSLERVVDQVEGIIEGARGRA